MPGLKAGGGGAVYYRCETIRLCCRCNTVVIQSVEVPVTFYENKKKSNNNISTVLNDPNLHDAAVLCPLNASIQALMHGRRWGGSVCGGFGPGLKSQRQSPSSSSWRKTVHDRIFIFMKSVFVLLLFCCKSMTKRREFINVQCERIVCLFSCDCGQIY